MEFFEMLCNKLFFALSLALVMGLQIAAAEPEAAKNAAPAWGPLVDLKLDNGDLRRGQLLSFSDGLIQLKTDKGEVLTSDRSKVQVLRFVVAEPERKPLVIVVKPPAQPTAQETELSFSEFKSLHDYRAIARLGKLSNQQEDEFAKLLLKLNLHKEALTREIRSADNDESATAQMKELIRSYLGLGTLLSDMKPIINSAADGIAKEPVRKNLKLKLADILKEVEEHIRGKIKKPL